MDQKFLGMRTVKLVLCLKKRLEEYDCSKR